MQCCAHNCRNVRCIDRVGAYAICACIIAVVCVVCAKRYKCKMWRQNLYRCMEYCCRGARLVHGILAMWRIVARTEPPRETTTRPCIWSAKSYNSWTSLAYCVQCRIRRKFQCIFHSALGRLQQLQCGERREWVAGKKMHWRRTRHKVNLLSISLKDSCLGMNGAKFGSVHWETNHACTSMRGRLTVMVCRSNDRDTYLLGLSSLLLWLCWVSSETDTQTKKVNI